jgi:hypothetical protein
MPRYLAKTNQPTISAMSRDNPVTLAQLKGAAADVGVEFAPGDILIVRTGWTEGWLNLSAEDRKAATDALHGGTGGICGVEASEEVMRWHWENGIAAVAGDTVAVS